MHATGIESKAREINIQIHHNSPRSSMGRWRSTQYFVLTSSFGYCTAESMAESFRRAFLRQ